MVAKGDSEASNHYFALRDSDILEDVSTDGPHTSVLLPDSSSLTSISTGQLPLSNAFSPGSKKTTILPNLQSSLVSLEQLCDDDCTVLLKKKKLLAIKNEKIIYTEHEANRVMVYRATPAPKVSSPAMNVIIQKIKPLKI